jgi:DNA-binding transcriptional ArsR family regulator
MTPNFAAVAALIGEPGRAAMLTALLDGRAQPAGALAEAAGQSPQGASGHLAQLLGAGLLTVETEGRHRYYRLANPRVAAALESLAALAPAPRPIAAPRDAEARGLRFARSCYDHLAGRLAVGIADAMESQGLIAPADGKGKPYAVSEEGRRWLAALGIEIGALRASRGRPLARRCLDWSERRHHLAGPLGTALLARFGALGWLLRSKGSRRVQLTPLGRRELTALLGHRALPATEQGLDAAG